MQYKKTLYIKAFFIVIMLFTVFGVQAQRTPGGTGYTVEFWLSADELSSTLKEGDDVTIWNDLAGKINFQSPAGQTAPKLTYNGLNFHKGVRKTTASTIEQRTKMIAMQTFSRSRSKAYYIFYVSKKNSSVPGSASQSVLSLSSTADFVGWASPNYGSGLTAKVYSPSNYMYHPTTGKNSAIGLYTVPNVSTGTRRLYQNGVQITANGGLTGSSSSNPVLFSTSTSANSTANYFNGDIYEIIVLSTTAGTDISNAELQRIQSYLAIKYGQSLTGQNDLFNSTGIKVWDSNKNRGYSSQVFGLGRDEKTNLYQKQSANTENSDFIVFQGDLATINSNNTSDELKDGDYVMFGNNALQGVVGYGVAAGTEFKNGKSFTDDLSYRHKQVYRVQLTGSQEQTVNFKLPAGKTIMLVSTSHTFDIANTDAYQADENNELKGVKLTGGEYISFIMIPSSTPVNYTTKVWLKADDITPSGTAVSAWKSAVGTASFNQSATGSRPAYNTGSGSTLMNYRTSVKFSSNSHILGGPGTGSTDVDLKINANESYYTFSVSKFDKAATGDNTTNAVLFTMNRNRLNYDTWTKGVPGFMTNNVPQTYSQTFGKKYGIVGIIRPNTDTDKQMIYFNGNFEEKDPQLVNLTSTTNYTPEAQVGGSSAGYNPFLGEVQEIILLSSGTKGQIDLLEAFKINSYLAFKYGLPLQTDYISALGTPFWTQGRAMDSNGTVYDKSIFGIGRGKLGPGGANAPELVQNQARPYLGEYQGPFTVYVGTFQPLSKDNVTTAAIPDETYLMFSSNANIRTIRPKEDPIPVSSVFKNGETNTFELNYSSAIYKVQLTSKTASSLPVTIASHITRYDNSYLLVSTGPDFKPTETELYSLNSANEVSVTLTDGVYVALMAEAQNAPGGVVEDLKMWLRADLPSTVDLDNNNVKEWKDASVSGVDFKYGNYASNYMPTYLNCAERLNYHEAVKFTSNHNDHLEYLSNTTGIMSVDKPDKYTFFTVFYNNFTNTATSGMHASYYMGFGSAEQDISDDGSNVNRRPAFGSAKSSTGSVGYGRFYEANYTGSDNSRNAQDGKLDLFKPKSTAIAVVEAHKGQKVRFEYDAYGEDVANSYPQYITGANANLRAPSTLGIGSRKQRGLDGQMGEIFAYERVLSEDEKISVYSYLGLKYGITLDNDKTDVYNNFDYTFSNGKILWAGTSNPMNQPFHNNVAALVRDDAAGLDNKVSHSTGDGAVINMAVVDDTNRDKVYIGCDNAANFTSLKDDKTAVVWGHNGMEDVYVFDPQADNVCGEMDVRFNKIWMVELVGMESQEVVIGTGGYGFEEYAYQSNDVYLLISTDLNSFESQQWEEAIPLYWQDGMHQTKYKFTEKYTYFTVGVKENPGACDACDSETSKQILFKGGRNVTSGMDSWRNGDVSGSFNLTDMYAYLDFSFAKASGTGTTAARFYGSNSSNYRYKNPRVYNGNTLRVTRINYLYDPLTAKLSFKSALDNDPIGASVEFDIIEIGGYTYRKYEDFVIWGICADESNPDKPRVTRPKVTYYQTPARSSYTLQEKKDVPASVTTKAEAGAGALAKRRPAASWSNNRSKMHVQFTSPVQEVYIQYKTVGSSARTGVKRFGISPISVSCPKPLPEMNEDRLTFVKYANPYELLLCQEFQLTYRIINGNCSPKEVNFHEMLPPQMKFVEETLSVDYTDALTNATVNFSSDASGKKLDISNMMVKPGGETTLRVTVRFETSATARKYDLEDVYIDYIRIIEGQNSPTITLKGSDLYSGTYLTQITANDTETRPDPVTITAMQTSTACYAADNVIDLTFELNNPNTMAVNKIETISNVEMEVINNEEFEIQNITIDVDPASSETVTITKGETGEDEDPGYSIYNFDKIPAGKHTVKVTVKAPSKSNLIQDEKETGNYDSNGVPITTPMFDESGRPVYVPFVLDFAFNLSDPDECGDSMLNRTEGSFLIEHCKEMHYIFSNKHITGKVIKSVE